MVLLEKINSCSDEELTSVVGEALQSAINNSTKVEKLGFLNGAMIGAFVHKGFISPDTRIKFNTLSMYDYSMKTTDYFYEFAKLIKEIGFTKKSQIVKFLQKFIDFYFGIPASKCDLRDDYLNDSICFSTKTEEEFFEKIENLEIGAFKNKNIAQCTERAAVAQNLLSLFGLETYWCCGCVEHDGKEEGHCINIVKGNNAFYLYDYSLPVVVYENGKEVNRYAFNHSIKNEELEDFLANGVIKEFPDYEGQITSKGIKFVFNGKTRKYCVGRVTLEEIHYKSR